MQALARSRSQTRTQSAHRWIAIAAAILVLLVVLYLAVGAVAANVLTMPKRQFNAANNPGQFNLAYEEVRFPSRGSDIQIAGWYIPRAASDRVVVLVHGKDASRSEEFYGAFVNLAAALQQSGFNVLLIDMRGHGQSGDARFSFGLNERRDIEGAVDWLASKGYASGRIGVLGVSLGAASAIGAAAEEPRIGALVTDSGFADWCPVMQKNWNPVTGLPDPLMPSVLLMNRVMYGYDLCDSRPVNEIGRISPRPILLIQSTGDQLVPVGNVYALKAAAPLAQIWVVSGPEHARIYNADPAAYSRRVSDFFDRGLAR